MLLAAGAVALLAVAATWWYTGRSAATVAPPFATIEPMRRLTNTGNAMMAAISPDGRYVVHVDGNFDKQGLWIRQASNASSVQINPPTTGSYLGLAFSPDGERVRGTRVQAPRQLDGVVVSNPAARRSAAQVVGRHRHTAGVSPDGKRMAFVRDLPGGGTAIVLFNADGTNQRVLASRAEPDVYVQTQVAWSPDGTLIAAFAGEMPKQKSRIVLVNVATGKEQAFSEARFDSGGSSHGSATAAHWCSTPSSRTGGRWNWNSRLWSIDYPAGTIRRITLDSASYGSVAATAEGRTLVAGRDDVRAALWVAPEGDTTRARPITETSNGREGATGIDWTPDGRIVYSATAQDSWDIWIVNSDGSQPRQLTNDPGVENQPQMLPDGKGFLFTSRTAGASDVLVRAVDLDGGNRRDIPTGGGIHRGYLQVAGDHIYFTVLETADRYRSACRQAAARARRSSLTDSSAIASSASACVSDERWAVGIYAEPGASA